MPTALASFVTMPPANVAHDDERLAVLAFRKLRTLQVAFLGGPLMRFTRVSDPILGVAIVSRQLFGDYIDAARR